LRLAKLHKLFRLICAFIAISLFSPLKGAVAADLPPPGAALDVLSPQPIANTAPTLRIGGYVGALSEQAIWPPTSCNSTLLCPWTIHFVQSYLVDGHAVYTFYRFNQVPIDLELEGGVAQRFGSYHQTEFDLIPVMRWKYFPWNKYLYTNFRAGLIGASYATGVSSWEAQNARNGGVGSNYLNFLRLEFTFAPSVDSPYEFFVGLHHRSGIFGLINGSHGGSNYWETGMRFNIF